MTKLPLGDVVLAAGSQPSHGDGPSAPVHVQELAPQVGTVEITIQYKIFTHQSLLRLRSGKWLISPLCFAIGNLHPQHMT